MFSPLGVHLLCPGTHHLLKAFYSVLAQVKSPTLSDIWFLKDHPSASQLLLSQALGALPLAVPFPALALLLGCAGACRTQSLWSLSWTVQRGLVGSRKPASHPSPYPRGLGPKLISATPSGSGYQELMVGCFPALAIGGFPAILPGSDSSHSPLGRLMRSPHGAFWVTLGD